VQCAEEGGVGSRRPAPPNYPLRTCLPPAEHFPTTYTHDSPLPPSPCNCPATVSERTRSNSGSGLRESMDSTTTRASATCIGQGCAHTHSTRVTTNDHSLVQDHSHQSQSQ
jgi:hypothetical protein